MVLHKTDKLAAYVHYLEKNPAELEGLFNDLLISVTGFFRDPALFQALQRDILPKLLKNRAKDAPLRLWSCGCATGEEAYSLAMLVSEALEASHQDVPVQIFASDLNERGIEKARAGIYHENILLDVSPERLRRFFTKVNSHYQVNQLLRDKCVFARQNVVTDPPFSNLDVVTCRNVLIYLTPVLQRRVFPTFHYALRPGGYLLLGNSENIGEDSDLFDLLDRKNRIYVKKTTAHRPRSSFSRPGRTPAHARPRPLLQARWNSLETFSKGWIGSSSPGSLPPAWSSTRTWTCSNFVAASARISNPSRARPV